MKTADQIERARQTVKAQILTPGLLPEQSALLVGMLNALVWVADGANATTMARLLEGEPLAPGKDLSTALARLKSLQPQRLRCTVCGKSVSSEVIALGELVVRAVIECPECVGRDLQPGEPKV